MDHHQTGIVKISPPQLETPVYLKLDEDAPWPQDSVFYLMTGDGVFLCRNHEFFASSVPASRPPAELATHQPFLKHEFPKIPRRLFEQAVGFFYDVYTWSGAEAGVLIAYNVEHQRLRLVCPEQVGTVSRSWGGSYPIGLSYEIPDLGADLLLGDIHSHGNEPAYASLTDQRDEEDRSGIHLVVGRLGDLPRGLKPDLHLELVVDGTRFTADPATVLEGYQSHRFDFPRRWRRRIRVKTYGSPAWTSREANEPGDEPSPNPDAGGNGERS